MKIKLEDMTWPAVAEILSKPHLIILPVGCIEARGYHLFVKLIKEIVASEDIGQSYIPVERPRL